MAKPKPDYYGNEDKYPKYDNYDAIEVSRTRDIPCDYDGVMGVPISFLESYNPEQFELLGVTDVPSNANNEDGSRPILQYKDAIQVTSSGKERPGNNLNNAATLVIPGPENKGTYYWDPSTGKYLRLLYTRLLIKRKAKSYDN